MALKSIKKQLELLSRSRPTVVVPLLFQNSKATAVPFSSSIGAPFNSPRSNNNQTSLSEEELAKINLLIPRLCNSNHLTTAIELTSTALLANPPQKSLSFSILIHSLTSQPSMSLPMSLLTCLHHSPHSHPHLTPIAGMFISHYFHKSKPKEALKVFKWMVRPGSKCELNLMVCGVLVNGFCVNGMVIEALRVLRLMVEVGLVPPSNLRKRVFGTLLKEARISEAQELDEALGCVGNGGDGESVQKALDLLDRMIANWTE